MVRIIFPRKAELTVLAVNRQLPAFQIVVFAYLIPRSQLLVAVVAEVVLQYVRVELLIGNNLVAVVALELNFVKDSLLYSIQRLERITPFVTIAVWTLTIPVAFYLIFL